MKLTKTAIDQAKFSDSKKETYILWDDALPGFGIRIYPSGRKSFVISYRMQGKKRIMVLGAYGRLTLDQARKMAKQKLAEVIGGRDPIESKNQFVGKESVEYLCGEYLEKYAKLHKKSWQEDERRIQKVVIPLLGNRKVQQASRSEIQALHQRIGKKAPYEANRILALLSKIFDMAVRWGCFLKTTRILPDESRNTGKRRETGG